METFTLKFVTHIKTAEIDHRLMEDRKHCPICSFYEISDTMPFLS